MSGGHVSGGARVLPFALDRQAGHLQCWAAVAVALRRWYGLAPVPTQAAFARTLMGDNCDHVCAPLTAFAHAGLAYDELAGLPAPDTLRAAIEAGHPVPACLRFFVGWHLVVVHGIDADDTLSVADPLHGPSRWPHARFKAAYREHYAWTHHYLPRTMTLPAANTL